LKEKIVKVEICEGKVRFVKEICEGENEIFKGMV
jgi:hypothetical protein